MKYFHLLLLAVIFIAACRSDKIPVPEKPAVKNEGKDLPKEFFFVGSYQQRASLFAYSFSEKITEIVWNNKKEQIILFIHNKDNGKGLFLTSTSFGKLGIFPFVNNIRAYVIDLPAREITPVKNFGNAMQTSAFIQDKSSFRLVYNVFGGGASTIVQQHIVMISNEGKVINDEKHNYDIAKDGYPQIPTQGLQTTSPDGRSYLTINDKNEVSLKIQGTKLFQIIASSAYQVHTVRWSSDSKFLVIADQFISPDNESLYDDDPKTSHLRIYSIAENKFIYEKLGAGFKNFNIYDNYVVYDTGFGLKSFISIIDLRSGNEIGRVNVQGGCGLRFIPLIPDYEA